MKRKFLSIVVFIIISAMFYFFYSFFFKKIDYYFSTNFIIESKVVTKGAEFKKEIISLGLKDKLISSDEYSTKIKLSKYQLNKILHSKKTKSYIRSYKKVDDVQVGIPTERGLL